PPIESAQGGMHIYPNPSSGIVTIQLNDTISFGAFLEIYNLVGQRVVTTVVNQVQFQLNISSLSKGVYYIRVNNGNSKLMNKFLKL
ncbi:MAG TPA: T9SS type A sorting domain-containing protein, partial [Puia sp.]|nr:T9SS type A sorting domain-containing protein [Puia sp.]